VSSRDFLSFRGHQSCLRNFEMTSSQIHCVRCINLSRKREVVMNVIMNYER
jgi:hypothetical protein